MREFKVFFMFCALSAAIFGGMLAGMGITGVLVILPLALVFGDVPDWLCYLLCAPLTIHYVITFTKFTWREFI